MFIYRCNVCEESIDYDDALKCACCGQYFCKNCTSDGEVCDECQDEE